MAGSPLKLARKLGIAPPPKSRLQGRREASAARKAAKGLPVPPPLPPARARGYKSSPDAELVKLSKQVLEEIAGDTEGHPIARVRAAQILMTLEKNLELKRAEEEAESLDLSSKTDAELEAIARGENPDPNREGIQ